MRGFCATGGGCDSGGGGDGGDVVPLSEANAGGGPVIVGSDSDVMMLSPVPEEASVRGCGDGDDCGGGESGRERSGAGGVKGAVSSSRAEDFGRRAEG